MPSEYFWRVRNANTSHQNTISGREDHQRGTQCHQNTISGRRDDDSWMQCHQNTISGREDNQRGTQCHLNTISGRKDRGPPRLGLTKLLTSGRRGFIYARWRGTPVASQTGWLRTLPRVPLANYEQLPGSMLPLSKTLL